MHRLKSELDKARLTLSEAETMGSQLKEELEEQRDTHEQQTAEQESQLKKLSEEMSHSAKTLNEAKQEATELQSRERTRKQEPQSQTCRDSVDS